MNPFGMGFTILVCVAVMILPRRYAFIPVILAACYITQGQQVDIFDAHFTSIRITIFFGFLRVAIRNELQQIEFHLIDKVFILWVLSGTTIYLLLWQTGEAFIYRIGLTYDAILMYLFFRSVFVDLLSVRSAVSVLAVIILPLALLMLYERFGLQNVFSVFGAVPEIPMYDGDRIRAMGPFRHPILAGSIGACLLPLFVGLWGSRKATAILGVVAAISIVIASNSSGPALSALCAIIAIGIWPLRNHMQILRRGLVVGLIALHLYMKDPVWFVIARISDLTGGTGWYRSYLIDRAIFYLQDWWMLGTKDTDHWMPTGLVNIPGADITNQFIYEGVRGGLLTMALFIVLFAVNFSTVGRRVRAMNDDGLPERFMVWTIGCSLFAHAASFMSVSYFDQSIIFFYLTMSFVGAICCNKKLIAIKKAQVL
jgi:hypothetical protein